MSHLPTILQARGRPRGPLMSRFHDAPGRLPGRDRDGTPFAFLPGEPSGTYRKQPFPFPWRPPHQLQPRGGRVFLFWYNGAMRLLALVLLLALAARAQETRTVKDAAGKIEITVPASWADQPLADGELIHLYAGHTGGHVVIVVREVGQAEVDKQRDRYMEHDASNYPGAEFLKIADPFFGYRMNDQAKNRVFLRGFLRDGADGIVATISSRFSGYDQAYAAETIAAMATLRLAPEAAAKPEEETAAPSRRIFDKSGSFSFVAPSEWKTMTPDEGEILALGHKGSSATASIRVVDEGSNDNPTLVLLTIQGQMKRDYASATVERVGTDPPTLLVKGRKEGWVDYLIAFAAGGHGYTLRLASREGAFDEYRPVADAMAKSLVLVASPYREPTDLKGDVTQEKKGFVVHAPAEEADAAGKALVEVLGFEKDWSKIAPVFDKRGSPIHIVLVPQDGFADASHGFGDVPAAYDRLTCAVVAVPPPADKEEALRWRGRVYAAIAEAALHRDLPVAPPAWLLGGLTACMESAGRTGEGPAAPHFALLKPLDVEKPASLNDVFAYTYADVMRGETLTPLAMSWGYLHVMLFGKSPLHALYAKWARELAKAKGTAPPLDVSKIDAETELKRHIERELKK
jgi:hypothetical protein